MLYDFDTVINRWHTDSEKYDGLKKFAPKAPDNSIPLWIADMDFKTAPEIITAMHRRVEEGIFGYTDIYDASYYKAVCRWMEKRHRWRITPDEIVVDSGVVPALSHALSLIARPGDGVIIHTPAYKPFFNSIRNTGMIPVYSRLCYSHGRFTIDFEDLEQKAEDENNKVLILCSPHNPTGRVWSQDELRHIVDICQKHGLFIICDEIHNDILRPGICHTPIASLYPDTKRLITCTAPSKTFNLAGNHLANIIIPDPDIREHWNSLYHYLPNPISVAAATAAYEEGEPWLDELNQYLTETFRHMETFFKANLPSIDFQTPEATYLAWINIDSLGSNHSEIENRFIENGLIIEGGNQFVENGAGFIRLNAAVPHSTIDTLLNKINHIFN